MADDKIVSFEQAMQRIEEIVALLENSKTSLDDSLSLFEEATKLCTYCNKRLDDAQKKVEQLIPVKLEDEDK